MRRRLPSLSPRSKRVLPWLLLLALAVCPAVALTRAWCTALLAWSLLRWSQALTDCPDGAGLRQLHSNASKHNAARDTWWAWTACLSGVMIGLYTQGSSDVSVTWAGYLAAWLAYARARRAHRTRLGAPELLSYAGGLLCILAPIVLSLQGGAASIFACAALAFGLRFGALWFGELKPATTLKLAMARRLVLSSAVLLSLIALCTHALAASAGLSAMWAVPCVLLAFFVGLRLPQVSRIFLPRAGARMACFERARDARGETSAQTLAHMLEILTESADAGDGAKLHLADEGWDQQTFAFLGTFPFAVVSTGTLAQLSKRRPDLRPWCLRLQREETCAWLRLGTEELPLGYLSVPEAYAAGALCYEEVRVLHELGLRISQRIVESSAVQESQERHSQAQTEQAALAQALEAARTHAQALKQAALGTLDSPAPVSYYSSAGTELLRALKRPLRPRRADLVLPPGVPIARLLASTQEPWYVIHASRFAEPTFAAQWTAVRAALAPAAVALAEAHLLSPRNLDEIDADICVYFAWSLPESALRARLTLSDLQERPEDIESTVLDELVQAGFAHFGCALGADDPARAYLVELAHAHGEALLRATIRRAVCQLIAPRTLTRADM